MRGVCPSGQMSVTFMYCRECPRKSCWDSITEDMKRFGPRIVLEDGEKNYEEIQLTYVHLHDSR